MLRICPKCEKVAGYNSWFKAFYCRNCGELFNGGERMSELEHCPICGDTAIAGATHRPIGNTEFYEVICVKCGARIIRSLNEKQFKH